MLGSEVGVGGAAVRDEIADVTTPYPITTTSATTATDAIVRRPPAVVGRGRRSPFAEEVGVVVDDLDDLGGVGRRFGLHGAGQVASTVPSAPTIWAVYSPGSLKAYAANVRSRFGSTSLNGTTTGSSPARVTCSSAVAAIARGRSARHVGAVAVDHRVDLGGVVGVAAVPVVVPLPVDLLLVRECRHQHADGPQLAVGVGAERDRRRLRLVVLAVVGGCSWSPGTSSPPTRRSTPGGRFGRCRSAVAPASLRRR